MLPLPDVYSFQMGVERPRSPDLFIRSTYRITRAKAATVQTFHLACGAIATGASRGVKRMKKSDSGRDSKLNGIRLGADRNRYGERCSWDAGNMVVAEEGIRLWFRESLKTGSRKKIRVIGIC